MIHFVIVGLLTIAATYGLYFGVFTNPNVKVLPVQASDQAIHIDQLFNWQFLAMSFFYSLIVIFILYSLIVFRRKKGETGDGDHIEGNPTLEIFWTIIPLVIVLAFAYMGAQTLARVERRTADPLEINVIASQWSWRFEYPEVGVSTNELVLPRGRQVLLRMRSEDVIHSFWVPEFRVKQDILPGGKEFVRELRITPTLSGTYKVRCAELCGTLHSTMLARVVVMEQPDYTNWLTSQLGECEDEAAVCGQRWATNYGCIACHSLDGTTLVGPSWLGLYESTVPLEDGSTVVADQEFLINSILDPNAQVHEGFVANVMPQTFSEQLNEDQIDQIVAFIESLK